jgi:hypothetical protein
VRSDAYGAAYPAVVVLAPGGEQGQGGLKLAQQGWARNSFAQDICGVPNVAGNDQIATADKGTQRVALQLLSQGAGYYYPATLSPVRSDPFHERVHQLQRASANRIANQIQQAEWSALGEHWREQSLRLARLSGLNQGGDTLTQTPRFGSVH